MQLHSTDSGTGPVLVILHGLFGSSDNWGLLQRRLTENFRVIALDLRNHGLSGHAAQIDYRLMAQDVAETLAHLGVKRFHLLGHSMGGKVAMTMSGLNTPGIDRLVVVDIAPKDYPPHHQGILDALVALDTSRLRSRKEADKALQQTLPDSAVRQFILKNLVRRPPSNSDGSNDGNQSAFSWRFNLTSLYANYANLTATPPDDTVFSQPLLVLCGTESDYVLNEDAEHFAQRFSQFEIRRIEGAGHWPHASHPETVIDELLAFLL